MKRRKSKYPGNEVNTKPVDLNVKLDETFVNLDQVQRMLDEPPSGMEEVVDPASGDVVGWIRKDSLIVNPKDELNLMPDGTTYGDIKRSINEDLTRMMNKEHQHTWHIPDVRVPKRRCSVCELEETVTTGTEPWVAQGLAPLDTDGVNPFGIKQSVWSFDGTKTGAAMTAFGNAVDDAAKAVADAFTAKPPPPPKTQKEIVEEALTQHQFIARSFRCSCGVMYHRDSPEVHADITSHIADAIVEAIAVDVSKAQGLTITNNFLATSDVGQVWSIPRQNGKTASRSILEDMKKAVDRINGTYKPSNIFEGITDA